LNHIILSKAATEVLKEKYETISRQYGYTKAFDSYPLDLLSFDGVYKLLDRCREGTSYYLVGKNCMLAMEQDRKHENCFYGKRLLFFQKPSEYAERLAQTLDLPGKWDIILAQDAYRLNIGKGEDISDFLEEVKASYREYYEFEGKWKTWDLYNSKLRELEERAEAASEREIGKVLLENNIFSIYAGELSGVYQEGTDVCALFQGEERFRYLGKASFVDCRAGLLTVVCEKHDILKAYADKQIGRIKRIRIIDFGKLARLKRQKEAMKILFQNEAANKNIRDIIMGRFPFQDPEGRETEITLKETCGLFGANVRQKEAFTGAVNAPDLYLIQGPPGTGKTTIITEIVRYAIQRSMKVLVSSETNTAVDNVLERIQHMGGIVPVRFGREERMDKASLPFTPGRIAETILANARERNAELDRQGVAPGSLIAQCREKWKKRDGMLAEEIRKSQESLPRDLSPDKLLEMAAQFEGLVSEVNDMHSRIEKERECHMALKDKLLRLEKERAELQEQLYLGEGSFMESGMKAADGALRPDVASLKRRLKKVEKDREEVAGSLAQNSYEILVGAYKRKMRRYGRRRQELADILGDRGSLMAAVHQTKACILDMQVLEGQRAALKTAMEEEMAFLAADYEHKQKLWEISRDIRKEWMKATEYIETKEEIEKIYMRKTNAVFATCSGIASQDRGGFAEMEYDYVIIDEAAKCNMMDILIPMVRGRKLILVGDHKQLYPMLETEELKEELGKEQIKEMKEHILFKWLYEEIVPKEYKIMLNRQYRMQKNISEFISENFYEGGLICEKESETPLALSWIDCENSREEKRGTSFINVPEAETVMKLAVKLDGEYTQGISVGIICIYKAQADYINGLLKAVTFKNIHVECSTVDAFQGREKHTIIFNTVRSARVSDFMRDENRVNVAVSRAQEYCYVAGRGGLMKQESAGILGRLYHYIKIHGGIQSDRYVG